jgi:VacB/RNase II family 3'-5' exoribonuclease
LFERIGRMCSLNPTFSGNGASANAATGRSRSSDRKTGDGIMSYSLELRAAGDLRRARREPRNQIRDCSGRNVLLRRVPPWGANGNESGRREGRKELQAAPADGVHRRVGELPRRFATSLFLPSRLPNYYRIDIRSRATRPGQHRFPRILPSFLASCFKGTAVFNTSCRVTRTTAPDMRSTEPLAGDRATLAAIARNAMIERGLAPDFSPAAQKETAAVTAPARDLNGARDLRNLLWCSIDNDDSRDLDQLTVAEALPNGQTRILVAIADVDALVHRGSAIDQHAVQNTTSVYTPAAIFSMLPERLSTDLTSLNEDEDRLAVVSDMTFDGEGTLVTSEVYRALTRNQAKLAYRSVAAWLDGQGPAPARVAANPALAENLRLQDRIAEQLATRRHDKGALSLETIQTRAVFDGNAIAELHPEQKNRAKQLIEDFMIAANGVTANYLDQKGFPSLRRVLRSPERWDRIVQLAATFGERLPGEPDAAALERFLMKRRQADAEKFPDLSLAVVKLIGRGEYAVDRPGAEPPGHFGLAVRDYAHSTAPNRRFPDLITQRLLKAALAGSPPAYTEAELIELAAHCTQQEDAATKVERRVRKSAEALVLAHHIGERFDAIVTGASPKGTWVRVLHPPVEGRLAEGFRGLDVGDHARVKLLRVDVERGFIDFARE